MKAHSLWQLRAGVLEPFPICPGAGFRALIGFRGCDRLLSFRCLSSAVAAFVLPLAACN